MLLPLYVEVGLSGSTWNYAVPGTLEGPRQEAAARPLSQQGVHANKGRLSFQRRTRSEVNIGSRLKKSPSGLGAADTDGSRGRVRFLQNFLPTASGQEASQAIKTLWDVNRTGVP